MFRKPKRKVKDALRKKDDEEMESTAVAAAKSDDSDEEGTETSELLHEARNNNNSTKRVKNSTASAAATTSKRKDAVMHTYEAKQPVARDLVTSTAEYHPADGTNRAGSVTTAAAPAAVVEDGIFRGDRVRNKFHAGPIRAAAHVRVTARFDYQPDVCKDYKETGFCGFGDTCIYLHDRGDTVSGWQLEQQWEEQQKVKKAKQEQEMHDFATGKKAAAADGAAVAANDDGIPFACHLCRGHFKEPVATNCLHYFCEACIMNYVRTVSEACPVCGKDTGSVFNLPAKLIAKKRKVLDAAQAKEDDSWEQYFKSFQGEAKKE